MIDCISGVEAEKLQKANAVEEDLDLDDTIPILYYIGVGGFAL